MSVLKPRTRVVYFRISEEEFCQWSQLCDEQGARSVSDLARIAMHKMLSGAAQKPKEVVMTTRLEILERAINDLHETVKSLQFRFIATSHANPE